MLTVMKVVLLLLLTSLHGVQSTTIYDARLSGGSSGTVQVLTHLGWQDLCSSSWSTYSSSEESRVLCRQLGYDVTSFNPSTSYFTSSAASTYFNSFSCSGTESEISECNYNLYSEQTSCSSYAVSVTCRLCTHGSVQLRGGVVPEAGTVEYCVSGTWKAVCDNSWDHKEAFVVCRQLEFPATGAITYSNSYFGHHSLPSNTYFYCFGNESSLSSCQSSTTTCNFANTAGVYCKGDVISEMCLDGHVQLAGGKDTREGRVEICSNGVWGTIYHSNWDVHDATVACKQLGLYQPYSRVEAFRNSYFGAGTGPILYASLNCAGTESTLAHCRASYSPLHYGASHLYDAGVRCNRAVTATRSDCSNGDVRLVNGSTSSEGRVEICYNGVWGSVCDSGWNDQDAAIVCLQLNFQGTNVTALRGSYFGSGAGPYYLSGVYCNGDERTLLQCGHTAGYNQILTCTPGHDAGVRCDASSCTHGDVRLFGGYTDHDGVAEVCINGFWADICDDSVSSQTVRTFCKQFIGAEAAYYSSTCRSCTRQRNTGNITLYGITCSGQSGSFIQDCSYSTVSGYSSGSCHLQEELIVGCYELSSCKNGDVRLRGGNSTFEGRVELCSQELWGSVVGQYYYDWDYLDARVACRQLGYPWEWAIAVQTDFFGRSSTRHVAVYFYCTGTENYLTNCSYSSISSSSAFSFITYSSAGVICQGNTSAPTQCEHGDVHLVGGQKTMEGRVEICAYGYWATVCYNNWDTVETDIVCNQLGLQTEGSEYLSGSYFGANYKLPIVRVSCSSGYTNISQCSVYNQTSGCNHRNEIGLVCQERKQYITTLIADQQSYSTGSRVTLNCTINHDDRKVTSYRWSSAFYRRVTSSSNTFTPTVPAYSLNSIVYYCQPLNGERILGMQRITLDIKGLLQGKINGTNVTTIQVRQQDTIHLQVEPEKANILDGLLGLTWYHNGSVVSPTDVQRYISSNNKTLTIANFTPYYSGVYKVQFDQLFVHPFDENCQEEVLSLLRHLPVLRPVVFCVNTDGICYEEADIQVRSISIENLDSALNGTLNNITLKANGILLSSKELKHSSILWYRNGRRVYSSLSLQKHYNNFSLSQEFQISNIIYEQSGRYEVLLRIYMYGYLRDHTCWPYYNTFVSTYLSSYVTIARGYVDVGFYKGLTFDLDSDKESAHRDDGATLTCMASIRFPPFSMILFIKDGETVATSTSGQLQIDTKSVNANPFGLYICQLNASGVTFNRTIFIKERANIKITTDAGNTTLCSGQDVSHNYSYVRNYFELNGKVYLNNSVLSLTDIGEGESALFCKTDKAECCGTRPNRFGEFYYPNGVKVPIEKLQETFYRSRGEQHIRLNRREEGNPTTGMYSCEIPNADDVLVKIYITLVRE